MHVVGQKRSIGLDWFPQTQQSSPVAMTTLMHPVEACPRCKAGDRIRAKLVLIEPADPARASDARRIACSCVGDLSVSDLKPEFATPGVSAQFIEGMYCDRCGIGYVPESIAKPPRARFIAAPGGWRRVYEDDTQGPLLERMADDPECHL